MVCALFPFKCPATDFCAAHLSVGAQADSAHEYLLKQYLMTAKTDKASLKMCMCSVALISLGFIIPRHRPSSHHLYNHKPTFPFAKAASTICHRSHCGR